MSNVNNDQKSVTIAPDKSYADWEQKIIQEAIDKDKGRFDYATSWGVPSGKGKVNFNKEGNLVGIGEDTSKKAANIYIQNLAKQLGNDDIISVDDDFKKANADQERSYFHQNNDLYLPDLKVGQAIPHESLVLIADNVQDQGGKPLDVGLMQQHGILDEKYGLTEKGLKFFETFKAMDDKSVGIDLKKMHDTLKKYKHDNLGEALRIALKP